MIKIAIDCMGGDYGLKTTLPAVKMCLTHNPDVYLWLFGHRDTISQVTSTWSLALQSRMSIVATDEVIEMGESPTLAYRKKRNSSMRKAIDAVQNGSVDAMVSSGNTGALVLTATLVLRPIEGLERPAIAAYLPTQIDKPVLMLDLGANAECTAQHLQQFAMMGSALSQTNGIEKPLIGLLNIGEELGKGNEVYKHAYELLRQTPSVSFYGNVEGTDIYKHTVDVVVCDGFVGNIALKTSEGVASMVKSMMSEEFKRHWWRRIAGLISYPILKKFKHRVDHRRFNGAVLLGLKGIVVKSHGSADSVAFNNAITRAYDAAHSHLIDRLTQSLFNMKTLELINTVEDLGHSDK